MLQLYLIPLLDLSEKILTQICALYVSLMFPAYIVPLLDLSEELLTQICRLQCALGLFYLVPASFERKAFDSNIPVGFE